MRTTASYLRVIGLVVLAIAGTEYFSDLPQGDYAVLENPFAMLFVFMVLIVAVGVEVSIAALDKVLYMSLSDEKRKAYDLANAKKANAWQVNFEAFMQKMTQSKAVEEEHEIELDHNYDGIRELDNRLPPWWVYSFYITIFFAVVYLARYHVFGDNTQAEDYIASVEQAEKEIAQWKEENKDFVNVDNVVFLEEADRLAKGEQIYISNCVACHKLDGGGSIGPNLTDKHWILGGGIKNVFNTISEGGRSGKGMVPWKNTLSPSEMQEVASYVLTFQGTTPEEGKAPQGDIWEEETE